MKTLPDDPVEQAKRCFADARLAFATDVDTILAEIRAFVDQLPDDAFTRQTRYDQWVQLRRVVLEKFATPMRSLEAALLRQLVTEAHELLTHPDEAPVVSLERRQRVDEWILAAAPFLRS